MIVTKILAHLAPHSCINCGVEGRLLCPLCARHCKPVPSCCYRCQRTTDSFTVCAGCRPHSYLWQVIPTVGYSSLAKTIIWQLKFNGAQAAACEMAALMTVPSSDDSTLLVPVVTATGRVRQRGYDQARLLARELAARSHLPYQVCLRRLGQTEQLGASRQQRLQQLESAFYCDQPSTVIGRSIILVDDVLTTGATLEAAARVMRQAGARQVSAVVFARA